MSVGYFRTQHNNLVFVKLVFFFFSILEQINVFSMICVLSSKNTAFSYCMFYFIY